MLKNSWRKCAGIAVTQSRQSVKLYNIRINFSVRANFRLADNSVVGNVSKDMEEIICPESYPEYIS